jgi:hypothetical protein
MMAEFVEFRFKLYKKSDARLLARIADQANGAGDNNAARFLLRHWFENERQAISPQVGQHLAPQVGQNEPDLKAAFADIDAEF